MVHGQLCAILVPMLPILHEAVTKPEAARDIVGCVISTLRLVDSDMLHNPGPPVYWQGSRKAFFPFVVQGYPVLL